MILCVGTNNLSKKQQTTQDTLKEILDIVDLCRNNGVNHVFVSSIINRPSYQSKVDEINKYLFANAQQHNYTFISNSNVHEMHLWRDKVHLTNQGIQLLANNFLDSLNKTSVYDNFY